MSLQLFNTLTAEAMASYVVREILNVAAVKAQANLPFTLALAGGSTPKLIYQQLSLHKSNMQHWQLLYSDERFLPEGNKDRNEELFKQAFGYLPSSIQHHPFQAANKTSLLEAATEYSQLINSINSIDICLLGMGEDGHSASLFPHNIQQNNASVADIITVSNASKAPIQRLSFNYSLIKKCSRVFLLACASSKHQALRSALMKNDETLPITHLINSARQAGSNNMQLLADNDACHGLSGFTELI